LFLALGIGAFFIPLILIWVGMKKFKKGKLEAPVRMGIGMLFFFIGFCSLLSLIGFDISSFRQGGGILGTFFSNVFIKNLGKFGSFILILGLFVLSGVLAVDFSPLMAKRRMKKHLSVRKEIPSRNSKGGVFEKKTEFNQKGIPSSYSLPSLSVLNAVPAQKRAPNEIKLAGDKLKQTLRDFGVEVEIAEVKEGPVVTRFEIKLAPGTKVSKITSLSSDLALSLAVPNVRIEVPVSGKSLVGVEVPKRKVNFVYIRELLKERHFKESRATLLFPLGKDIAGDTVWVNLEFLPHLLIGGATGSGKSVCINSIIISILYRSSPQEVKFLLIDPKMVELVDYEGIPHLIFPPIKETKEANSALGWVVQEMKRRYQRFNQAGVRNISGFNAQIGDQKEMRVPYLVVIIDELADLMMSGGTRLEKTICRIAQLGRATGIHLILATQRPSVDVITGLIKANFPSRISFAVASQVDSRTILDTTGAEKLVGNGDMLYSPVEVSKPFRVQGTFVSPAEVKRVVGFLKEEGEPTYIEEVVKGGEEGETTTDHDELYEEAKELVTYMGKASTSLLQRRLSIGYNRAGRIMDALEREGIVGPQRGSKPREVLMRKGFKE
ncbi:MAG: DNA translocase FtsK 4TM domain-containing protein, partial [Candidatus Aerophobetes bacterium]|nr:DNA translocase FtsK 4TM domain-containing protein [Candidatus Aerophobetes bacterium]